MKKKDKNKKNKQTRFAQTFLFDMELKRTNENLKKTKRKTKKDN